jgi:hypothetical protein
MLSFESDKPNERGGRQLNPNPSATKTRSNGLGDLPSDGEDDLEHDPGSIGEGRVVALGLGHEPFRRLAGPRGVVCVEGSVEGATRGRRNKVGSVGITVVCEPGTCQQVDSPLGRELQEEWSEQQLAAQVRKGRRAYTGAVVVANQDMSEQVDVR